MQIFVEMFVDKAQSPSFSENVISFNAHFPILIIFFFFVGFMEKICVWIKFG